MAGNFGVARGHRLLNAGVLTRVADPDPGVWDGFGSWIYKSKISDLNIKFK